jgi:hypothetical protein
LIAQVFSGGDKPRTLQKGNPQPVAGPVAPKALPDKRPTRWKPIAEPLGRFWGTPLGERSASRPAIGLLVAWLPLKPFARVVIFRLEGQRKHPVLFFRLQGDLYCFFCRIRDNYPIRYPCDKIPVGQIRIQDRFVLGENFIPGKGKGYGLSFFYNVEHLVPNKRF